MKRFISMLLAVIILISSFTFVSLAATSGSCGSGVTWELSSSGVLTISGSGAMGDYGYTDGKYNPWNSYRDKIKEVNVKSGVTKIGSYAFYKCSALTKVTIADSVKAVNKDAFKGCSSLKSYTVPKNVTDIGRHLFHDCTSLEKVTIHSGVKTINNNAFENCSAFNEIVFEGTEDQWSKINFVYSGNTERDMLLVENFTIKKGSVHKHSFSYYTSDKVNGIKYAKCDTDYCYKMKVEKLVTTCPHWFCYWVYNFDADYGKNATETSTCWYGCGTKKTRERANSMLVNSVNKFNDVKKGAWYVEYIDFVVGHGIFSGTSAKTFAPTGNITRAMFVTLLYRLAGIYGEKTSVSTTVNFTDVPKKSWYYDAVNWAASKEITTGTSATTFSPNKNITRQEICAMLIRFSDRVGILVKTNTNHVNFTDTGSIANWAKEAVSTCQEGGLINGYPNGKFGPTNTATRGEVAKILTLYYKYNMYVMYENKTNDEDADW